MPASTLYTKDSLVIEKCSCSPQESADCMDFDASYHTKGLQMAISRANPQTKEILCTRVSSSKQEAFKTGKKGGGEAKDKDAIKCFRGT